ncbi:MAG: YfhO family protein, partial [Clostridiales bacterium]|nr:YfhO family protein [Clostridiales bacterium]
FSFRQEWYGSLFPAAFDGVSYFVPAETVEEEAINYSDYDINAYLGKEEEEEEDENVVVDFLSSDKKFDPDDLGVEDLYDPSSNMITLYRTNKSIPMIINYKIKIESPDELYMNVSTYRTMNNWTLRVNGERYTAWPESTFYSTIARIGSFEEGSEINVSIVIDRASFKYLSIKFAYLDKDAFDEAFSGIDTSSVSVGTVQDGYVSMTSDLGQGQTILTTIPCEDGWKLYIDGQETEITPYQGALIGIDPGTGHHDIELVFTAPGLKAGAVISVLGIIGLIASQVVIKKNKQTK